MQPSVLECMHHIGVIHQPLHPLGNHPAAPTTARRNSEALLSSPLDESQPCLSMNNGETAMWEQGGSKDTEMERTCSEIVTVCGPPPPLGTELNAGVFRYLLNVLPGPWLLSGHWRGEDHRQSSSWSFWYVLLLIRCCIMSVRMWILLMYDTLVSQINLYFRCLARLTTLQLQKWIGPEAQKVLLEFSAKWEEDLESAAHQCFCSCTWAQCLPWCPSLNMKCPETGESVTG